MPSTPKKESAANTETTLTGTNAEDDAKTAQDIATHADRPTGSQVYRWVGTYAQEFIGPNDTTPMAAPGDYVELDLAMSPLAGEFWDDGLLIEAPGQTAGPAPEDETIAAAKAEEAAAAEDTAANAEKK